MTEAGIKTGGLSEASARSEQQIANTTYALAFLSGAAALIYQVTWVKMISLSLGSTTLAAGAVIGSFMAGMGIGARLYDPLFRRARHAFRLYALLEFGIALTTAAITLTLYSLPHVYAQVHRTLGGTSWLLPVFRFVLVFVLLLLPSALMGATFPALCTALIRSTKGVGRHLGMIYGLNTLGAAAGAITAGFVLIEAVGNRASTWVANACNIGVALTAVWLWRRVKETTLDEIPSTEKTALESRLPRSLVGAVLIGSGFATMAYEVFWLRALKYIVGNSTYAISMVLVVFLTGLGIGGVLFRRVIQRRHPEHDLGMCQLAIALLAMGAVGLEALLLNQGWFAEHVSIYSLRVQSVSWPSRLFLAGIVSIVLLLPPTVAMGLSFPLASRLYVEDVRRLGRGVGTAYLLANIGSVTGVIAGSVFLLPAFGTAGATKLVAGLNLVLGLAVVLHLGHWSLRRFFAVALPFAGVVILGLALPSQIPFRGELRDGDSYEQLFLKEGDVATVEVVHHLRDDYLAITIDGYLIGGGRTDNSLGYKQKLLAHFPMLLVPDARRTLNIGLGSGTTLAILADYPDLELLDCVEIVPEVLSAARFFDEFAALNDPRVAIHVDDAVHFLLTTDTVYDIIIADGKQNPKFSGNAAILSEEFHRYCLDRLAADGVLIEWLSYASHPRAFRATVRSFCDVFPEVAAYHFVPDLIVLIGSKQPVGADPSAWPSRFAIGAAREDMAGFYVEHPMFLLASRVSDGPRLKSVVKNAEKNTWDHPVLEFINYKRFEPHATPAYAFENLQLLHSALRKDEDIAEDPPDLPGKYVKASRILRQGFIELFRTGEVEPMRKVCQAALRANPQDSYPHSLIRKIPGGYSWLTHPGKLKRTPATSR